MDKLELNNLAIQLINQAKDISKERILAFAQEIYGTPQNYWNHLWETPIVPTYDSDSIFPVELSTIDSDELLDIIDGLVESEIDNEEAVYIPFEKIFAELPEEAQKEYEELVKSGSIDDPYRSVIVYNEGLLQSEFKGMIEGAKQSTSNIPQEQINRDFTNLISKVFTHERLHLNTNILIPDSEELNPNQVRHQYGVRFNDITKPLGYDFEDYDEVLIDTMALLIENHSQGENIENTLEEIITNRNGKSSYEDYDDRPVLVLFSLFPEELSEWTLIELGKMHKTGEPTNEYHNLLLEKYKEVFGGIETSETSKLLQLAGNYFSSTSHTSLEEEQIEKRSNMLKKLGVKNIDLSRAPSQENAVASFDFDSWIALAFSEEAMEELSNATQDIRAAKHELERPNSKEKNNDIEP